jgi:hypothetical protein
MIFLIPAITEKALGTTKNWVWDYGKYQLKCCMEHLQEGQFVTHPTVNNQGTIYWSTQGKSLVGPENGYVTASIKFNNETAAANFGWSNPPSGTMGSNSCVVNIDPPLKGILKPSCFIEQGSIPNAFYCINGALTYPYHSCSVSQSNTPPKSK